MRTLLWPQNVGSLGIMRMTSTNGWQSSSVVTRSTCDMILHGKLGPGSPPPRGEPRTWELPSHVDFAARERADPMLDAARLAEQVRTAVVEAGVAAYHDATLQGLCGDGAWEVAVGAMRRLDVRNILLEHRPTA
jgi:hypothetical protein